jgi:hypothetical protein
LPALPHPYFEYLFADAGVETELGNQTSESSVQANEIPKHAFIDSTGRISYGFIKFANTKSYKFVKSSRSDNPYVDPVRKSDSDELPQAMPAANTYPSAVKKGNSIDNLSFQKEDEDKGRYLRLNVHIRC